ncbi:lebercilin-like [Belonocnema kinseyi]|uniref:lebercilin-like n=1 Tax=Belonocnema kinseyi TaxID=2817044 RepID=UPI00143CE6EC|nr:lebercilin-like [Belonocnema kinseyi]
MTEFSSDLKDMLNEMSELRKALILLKSYNEALEKLIEKQKQALNRSRTHSKKLMELITEKYRSVFESKAVMKDEITHLRTVVNDLQLEVENQTKDLKTKDELFSKLEDELEILRSQIDLQVDEHQKQIEAIQERNRIERSREVSQYQTKLDAANAEIEKLKERIEHRTESQNKIHHSFNHPAWSDGESSNKKGKDSVKRKKKPDIRWPNLNITTSVKAEHLTQTAENSTKKKKLFLLDNDNITDLKLS